MKKYDKSMPCIKWIAKKEFVEEERRRKINADSLQLIEDGTSRPSKFPKLSGWHATK